MNKSQRGRPRTFSLLACCLWGASLGASLLYANPIYAKPVRANCDWPAWQQFKQAYISEQGRVIDVSDPRQITTSEGQSYGLFFALVAKDHATFERLVDWTENNLAEGDLSARLPAWLWGQDEQQAWGVLDANSASDSDLWLAYDLLEAGRLWDNRRYQVLGTLLLQRIAREEVADIPGLGVMLLPGKVGFVHQDDEGENNHWTLNPSYLPPQLLARFAEFTGPWQAMQASYWRLLTGAAPLGLVPDWIVWHSTQGWQPAPSTELKNEVDKALVDEKDQRQYDGSYDAIRNYLWLGMLADDAPNRAALLAQVQPMAELVAKLQLPPERINSQTGASNGTGPVGFSAALLPLLLQSEKAASSQPSVPQEPLANSAPAITPASGVQGLRLAETPFDEQAYYNSVLRLFGEGWYEERYRFTGAGELIVRSHACQK